MPDGEERCDAGTVASSLSSPYRLFGRQTTIHQMMGGGKGIYNLIITVFIIAHTLFFLDVHSIRL